MLPDEVTQVRSLRTAGRSPIGPKRQENWSAAEVAKLHRSAVQGGELEIRRRLVSHVRLESALIRAETSHR